MKIYNKKRVEMNTHTLTHTPACTHTHTYTHTLVLKVKKLGLTEIWTRIKEKKYLYLIRLTLMYCPLPTKLMIIYYVTPMIPIYTGFYLFPLSRAVNSNCLIFNLSEVEIHQ